MPCLVDKNGVQPTAIGALPPQLAALMQTNINVQALTVEAALTGKREHIYHAAMLDPHTAAELDLDQIHALVDDLIAAHGDWLPGYRKTQLPTFRKVGNVAPLFSFRHFPRFPYFPSRSHHDLFPGCYQRLPTALRRRPGLRRPRARPRQPDR